MDVKMRLILSYTYGSQCDLLSLQVANVFLFDAAIWSMEGGEVSVPGER